MKVQVTEEKIMHGEEDCEPVTRITLTYGATFSIAPLTVQGMLPFYTPSRTDQHL
jgi:hypothetical protein